MVEQLLEDGTAAHAYLGVQTTDATGGGARVASVVRRRPGGGRRPARRRRGRGRWTAHEVEDSGDLSTLVGKHSPGDEVTLDGHPQTATEQTASARS